MRGGGLLTRFGLVDLQRNDNLRVTDVVETLLSAPRLRASEIRGVLLGESQPASLDWQDFDHIGAARDLAARIGAAGEGVGAANIIILRLQLFVAALPMAHGLD